MEQYNIDANDISHLSNFCTTCNFRNYLIVEATFLVLETKIGSPPNSIRKINSKFMQNNEKYVSCLDPHSSSRIRYIEVSCHLLATAIRFRTQMGPETTPHLRRSRTPPECHRENLQMDIEAFRMGEPAPSLVHRHQHN